MPFFCLILSSGFLSHPEQNWKSLHWLSGPPCTPHLSGLNHWAFPCSASAVVSLQVLRHVKPPTSQPLYLLFTLPGMSHLHPLKTISHICKPPSSPAGPDSDVILSMRTSGPPSLKWSTYVSATPSFPSVLYLSDRDSEDVVFLFIFFLLSVSPQCESRIFYVPYSLLPPQHLEECFVPHRCPVNICGLNTDPPWHMMGLHPRKPTVSWRDLKSEMHLIHLTSWTS